MAKYAIKKPKRPSIAIINSPQRFPVRRIYCVGQNYAKHIAEMGGPSKAAERKPPFFFQKPSDAIVASGQTIAYPKLTQNLHYEVEMVLAIGRGGEFIAKDEALEHIYALGVGVDLTRRDRQAEMKAAGRSWEIAKAFDNSAPVSNLIPVEDLEGGIPSVATISLQVNGIICQCADLSEMIWSPAEIISTLSTHYRLYPGDIIFSGTPQGVGPISEGDYIRASVDGLPDLEFTIGGSRVLN
ncbi:MAG: fumarylacetoacetate hydrolase family protein [Robiginitomaculum sp.]